MIIGINYGRFYMSLEKSIQQLIKKEVQKEIEKLMSKHSDVPDSKFDIDELEKGIEVELEHTDSVAVAKAIAKDHLLEDPKYYTNMEKWHDDSEKSMKEEVEVDEEQELEQIKKEYYNDIKELFPDEDIEDIDWYDLEKENFVVKSEYYQLIIPSINFDEIYYKDTEDEADEKIINQLEDDIQTFIYYKVSMKDYEKIIDKKYILKDVEAYRLVEYDEDDIIIQEYIDSGIIENIFEIDEKEKEMLESIIESLKSADKEYENISIENIVLAKTNSLYFDIFIYNKDNELSHTLECRIANHKKLIHHKTYKKFDIEIIYNEDNDKDFILSNLSDEIEYKTDENIYFE